MIVDEMHDSMILDQNTNIQGFIIVVFDDVDEFLDLCPCHANATYDNTFGGFNCTYGDEYLGDDCEFGPGNSVACLQNVVKSMSKQWCMQRC